MSSNSTSNSFVLVTPKSAPRNRSDTSLSQKDVGTCKSVTDEVKKESGTLLLVCNKIWFRNQALIRIRKL